MKLKETKNDNKNGFKTMNINYMTIFGNIKKDCKIGYA